jgi:hypothetical protein
VEQSREEIQAHGLIYSQAIHDAGKGRNCLHPSENKETDKPNGHSPKLLDADPSQESNLSDEPLSPPPDVKTVTPAPATTAHPNHTMDPYYKLTIGDLTCPTAVPPVIVTTGNLNYHRSYLR